MKTYSTILDFLSVYRHTDRRRGELQGITIGAPQACERGLKEKHEAKIVKTLSKTLRE